MTASFELDGNEFTALNGGPHFKFNEAVSFQINCDDQEEVDYYWEKVGEAVTKKHGSADGSRINTASPGRSFPLFCLNC